MAICQCAAGYTEQRKLLLCIQRDDRERTEAEECYGVRRDQRLDGWTYFIHGWTQVIADVFHIDIPSAAMAAVAIGRFASLQPAISAFVRYEPEILPDPTWAERYARMQPIFDKLYLQSQPFYDALDALSE